MVAFAMSLAMAATEDEKDRDVHILDVDGLRANLLQPAILDVQAQEDFLKAHIRPAQPLDVEELETTLLSTPEPEGGRFLEFLSEKPIAAKTRVVLYDKGGPGRRDGYAAWLLVYGGIADVSILDGGLGFWNRRRLGFVAMGYPFPAAPSRMKSTDLTPRPELRVDPQHLARAVESGASLVEVLPFARPLPTPDRGQLRVDELLDERGLFLYPFHLRRLLESREVEPDSRLLFKGERYAAGLAWATFVANGFNAALVMPVLQEASDESEE